MARPRGRQKTVRLTVNLDQQAYGALLAIAQRQDAPLAWVVRRAVINLISQETGNVDEPQLALKRTTARRA